MTNTRIIARLDIKGPNMVKGVHLEGLRVLGDPRYFAEEYYQDGVDEMIYMDTVASLYGRNSLTEFVNSTAKSIFVPLTVGGGVRSIEDISTLLRAGADKVAINTAAIKNPELIREASQRFGAQCVVLSVEAKKISDFKYECYTDNGREKTGVDVLEWCVRAQGLGAGEILLTSIDFEGTGMGYDIALTKQISEAVSIPVIASGGCGQSAHIAQVILEGKADAVAVASIFHYGKLNVVAAHSSQEHKEGNVNYLKDHSQGQVFGRKNIHPTSIPEVKKSLMKQGVPCRT